LQRPAPRTRLWLVDSQAGEGTATHRRSRLEAGTSTPTRTEATSPHEGQGAWGENPTELLQRVLKLEELASSEVRECTDEART
jgi:hypothetical protein